jgi:hypothetical protein
VIDLPLADRDAVIGADRLAAGCAQFHGRPPAHSCAWGVPASGGLNSRKLGVGAVAPRAARCPIVASRP